MGKVNAQVIPNNSFNIFCTTESGLQPKFWESKFLALENFTVKNFGQRKHFLWKIVRNFVGQQWLKLCKNFGRRNFL